MLILVVCGQDIRRLSLGLVRDGALEQETDVAASPEAYLSTLATALAQWGETIENLDAVAVVTGPGSFTSSRVSTVIANGIAFARHVPVIAITNVARHSLRALVEETDLRQLPPVDQFAVPAYDRPPHITFQK